MRKGPPMSMRKLAKWHIWLGWLIGVPLIMWTLTGLLMVSRPIEEVRGTHLRQDIPQAPLPANAAIAADLSQLEKPVKSLSIAMEGSLAITRVTYMDGTVERYSESGRSIPALNEIGARTVVARQIVGGNEVDAARFFTADEAPLDLRQPVDSWQVKLADGTNIYVAPATGDILAVRTPFWRLFDLAWGLHIMDLETREDTSHPVLIVFTALSAIGVVMGTVLLFRRRKARPKPTHG